MTPLVKNMSFKLKNNPCNDVDDAQITGFPLSFRTRSSSTGSNCSSNLPILDDCVSQWDRRKVEKNFHIFYKHDFFHDLSDVIDKIQSVGKVTEEQNEYAAKLKHYTEQINGENVNFHCFQHYPTEVVELLNQTYDKLQDEQNECVKERVTKFIRALSKLAKDVRTKIDKGSFTRLLADFAGMCGLHAQITFGQADQAMWKDLKNMENVVSHPDVRLLKYGTTYCKSSAQKADVVASVVLVKKDSDLELPSERLESTCLSHGSSTCSLGEEIKPSIEEFLHTNILGQHAGELLLDLHAFYKNDNVSLLTMPGMIVDGTKVYFTVLEMSKKHFRKLEENLDLDESDRAVIFYSKPYDILLRRQRNILINNFIKLNNIEYIQTEPH